MKRLRLLTASALATAGFIAPSSPALAHFDACAGTGTATLSTGLGLPGTFNSAGFTFGFTAGACVSGGGVTATGTIGGSCSMASGGGTLNGHPFTFIVTGSTMTLNGPGVFGQLSFVEDPFDAGSCG